MKGANQIFKKHNEVRVTSKDLLAIPNGSITEEGLRWNIDVGLQYLAAWLGGNGCVPLYNLMEDAATAEICRAQLWQWLKHGAKLHDGRPVTIEMVHSILETVMSELRARIGDERFQSGKFTEAAGILESITISETFPEFLTQEAYKHMQ